MGRGRVCDEERPDARLGGEALGQLVLRTHRRFEVVESVALHEEDVRHVSQRLEAELVGAGELGPQGSHQYLGRGPERSRQVLVHHVRNLPGTFRETEPVEPGHARFHKSALVERRVGAVQFGRDGPDNLLIEEVFELLSHGAILRATLTGPVIKCAGHTPATAASRSVDSVNPDWLLRIHGGRLDDAERYLLRSLRRAPEVLHTRLYLAHVTLRRGNTGEAITMLQRILRAPPSTDPALRAWNALAQAQAQHLLRGLTVAASPVASR
ncbi:MAG: hypothetical protein AB2A00_34425 [Myxococcota bacterium]